MILKNYWALCEAYSEASGSYSNTYYFPVKPVKTSGTEAETFSMSLSSANVIGQMMPKNGLEVLVGSGSTEPDYEDYALAQDETANFDNYSVTQTRTMSATGEGYDIVFLVTGNNNTGSSITLTEVGIIKKVSSSFASPDDTTIMLARFLLADPIPVADGGAFTFAFKWSDT